MNNEAKRIVHKIRKDPYFMIKNILCNKFWSKQREIAYSVWDNPRTTVRTCHSIGKTFTAGNLILAYLYAYKNAIVLNTAPTWRQAEKLMWKEIRSAYARAKFPLGGKLAEKTPELQIIQDQWYAMALSTNDPNRFQGFHEKHILVVVDEAAGISEAIFEAIEGVLTTEHARLLLLGNPTSPSGTFYKSFKETGWNKIHIGAFDTPNFVALGIGEEQIADGSWEDIYDAAGRKLVSPNLITPMWVADKYKRWGPNSIMYIARVKGDFPEQATDSLIPLSWIEAAHERWEEEQNDSDFCEQGVDVAEYGKDAVQIATLKGNKILPLETFNDQSLMVTVGCAILSHKRHGSTAVKIDTIGIGSGVQGRMSEQGYPALRVNVAEAPGGTDKNKETFLNKRSQLYWHLRERLNPNPLDNANPISLPPDDDELAEELANIRYKINSSGKIQIEPKDETKKRIGRSPDRADAVMLACAPQSLLDKTIVKQSAGVW